MSRREAELSAKVAELRVALGDLESLKIRYFNFCHQSEQQEAQWSRMLAEKDIAMKEMYHRIKNNLQLISSLMRMQAELVTERHASAALTDCQQRIRSMALIHEHLYGNGCNDEINFGQFTRSLVGELSSSYAVGTQIRCAVNTNPVTLHAEKAIPCGLIVNELVSNAFKYAYPSGQGGEIRVNLAEDPAGRITLSISDHGVGLPAGFDCSNSHSMGLPLVEPLARQIGATLTVNQQGGIGGRPVKFNFLDDQSVPQTTLQLANGLVAKGVPVIFGSSVTATCNAIVPLLEKAGPINYCFSPGVTGAPRSYVFSSSVGTRDIAGSSPVRFAPLCSHSHRIDRRISPVAMSSIR